MTGKASEMLELESSTHDDDEYHTPMVSRRGSIFTLPASLSGSQDSYRGSPVYLASSMTWNEQPYPATRSDPDDQDQTNDPSTGIQQNSTTVASSSGFGYLGRYFSDHEEVVLDLQSANATLTERVGQLESSHNAWQDIHTRVAALESMQLGPHVTTKTLEPRILKLESTIASLDDTSAREKIEHLERMMENERRERRARVADIQKQTKSLTRDVAVVVSENEGLRERLNKLTGQVRNLEG
jgi:FtsZ-binding cell division protein ZapB